MQPSVIQLCSNSNNIYFKHVRKYTVYFVISPLESVTRLRLFPQLSLGLARRKIRLIESNAKCRYSKKFLPVKGLCGRYLSV